MGIAGGLDEEGWQYGSGIFETLLMIDRTPLLFDRHMDRAESSGELLGIEIPPREEILRAISYLARFPKARVRLSFGSQFSLSISAYESNPNPLKVQISPSYQSAGIGLHKAYPYWRNLDLLRAARFEGFDELLLIDDEDRVGEGATCSYLFLIEGQWVTPPLSTGVFPGIIRGLALESGMAIESEVFLKDLPKVQSAIALSSLRIATPVASLGEYELEIGIESKMILDFLWSEAQSDSEG